MPLGGRRMELGSGVLPATPAVPSTDEVVTRRPLATPAMLAAYDGITDSVNMRTVAVARRLGFGAQGAEVARAPMTLGTDMLLTGAAVGLEVDDESGRAVRAGHFSRHWYLLTATLKSVFRAMGSKGRKTRRQKKQTRRRPRVALTRMSSSVGMVEPVRVQPPTLVPRKGLQMKSGEETK